LHAKAIICINVSFFPDQYNRATIQVTTSDITTNFHITFKPQIEATSATLSKQSQVIHNVKESSLATPTVADVEGDTHSHIQTSTPTAESSTWSSREFHEVNKIKNDTYLMTLKGPTGFTATLSLEDLLEETIVTHSTASVDVLSDVNSTEKNAELSTLLPIKLARNYENKNSAPGIKLENTISHEVKGADISLKMDASSEGSNTEYVKVKRHATVEDRTGKEMLKYVSSVDNIEVQQVYLFPMKYTCQNKHIFHLYTFLS
jgi:hypothetical protein